MGALYKIKQHLQWSLSTIAASIALALGLVAAPLMSGTALADSCKHDVFNADSTDWYPGTFTFEILDYGPATGVWSKSKPAGYDTACHDLNVSNFAYNNSNNNGFCAGSYWNGSYWIFSNALWGVNHNDPDLVSVYSFFPDGGQYRIFCYNSLPGHTPHIDVWS
ncbi:MAG TPA: hypothetical protein VLF69_05720 [Candidatus Saccharimonadales bacterium]|nr:hypothetical protein [Candidatus Saccharimonadales bacterium]